MKQRAMWLLVVLVVLFVAIQFWPVERTNPPVVSDIQAPPEVKGVLHAACYNCHSNETYWPWYSRVAPMSWLIARDVKGARAKFNFSEWGAIPPGDRPAYAKQMWREIESGGMPPSVYRISHAEARLSQSQKDILRDWATSNPK